LLNALADLLKPEDATESQEHLKRLEPKVSFITKLVLAK
jgi:hypothetical protein